MAEGSVARALVDEHRLIDAAVEGFVAGGGAGETVAALTEAIAVLRRHIYAEEELVFPRLRDPALAAPVFVMLREHAQIWSTLDALDRALAGEAPADAAEPLCRQLLVQLQHHNVKEERVLYPQTDDALPAPTAAGVAEFLAVGEVPAGWVCIRARA